MNKFNKGGVFLSYVDNDLSKVWNIYEGLTRRGVNVTFEKMNFKHGDWVGWVSEAINLSSCFVFCVSDEALGEMSNGAPDNQAKNIRTAYEISQNVIREDFVLVPVMIEDCCYGNFYLSSLVRYDLFNDFERELDNLAVALGGRSSSDPDAIDKRSKEDKEITNLMGRAETAFYSGYYAKSIITWKHVLTLRPDICEAWNNKGIALCKIGHIDDAIDAYDQAIKIKPDYHEAWKNKSNALYSLGYNEKADASDRQAIKFKSTH